MAEYTQSIDLPGTDIQRDDPVLGDVRKEWDWVSKGVKEVLEGSPHLTYRPEDVYAACLTGQALLWITSEGFVVSTVEVDEFTDVRTFLVWIAWAGRRGNANAAYYLPFVEEQARRMGCGKIEVRTDHMPVAEYLKRGGWNLDTIVLTRDL